MAFRSPAPPGVEQVAKNRASPRAAFLGRVDSTTCDLACDAVGGHDFAILCIRECAHTVPVARAFDPRAWAAAGMSSSETFGEPSRAAFRASRQVYSIIPIRPLDGDRRKLGGDSRSDASGRVLRLRERMRKRAGSRRQIGRIVGRVT